MDEFIRLFNRGQYFEAHEVLEAVWLKETGASRNFYQGLIQLAAMFVHLQKGNPTGGAEALYEKAKKHLTPYGPEYGGFRIPELLSEAARSLREGTTGMQLG